MAMRWYSVSVLSNFEKKVAEAIRDAARQHHLEEEIAEVMVPTEDVIEIRRGKKVQTEKRFMPGYVLVKMEMSDRTYHLITSLNRVTGFLGPQGKPTPIRPVEQPAQGLGVDLRPRHAGRARVHPGRQGVLTGVCGPISEDSGP
jgi:transcriptional antiterminator NusG